MSVFSDLPEYDNDGVGDPWFTGCSVCGEWMKLSINGALACPICDMADERYDPMLESNNVWPSVAEEFSDEEIEWRLLVDAQDWDDDYTEDGEEAA